MISLLCKVHLILETIFAKDIFQVFIISRKLYETIFIYQSKKRCCDCLFNSLFCSTLIKFHNKKYIAPTKPARSSNIHCQNTPHATDSPLVMARVRLQCIACSRCMMSTDMRGAFLSIERGWVILLQSNLVSYLYDIHHNLGQKI